MILRTYSPKWQNLRRAGIWISILTIVCLIGSMVKGFGGSESLFKRWEVPGYFYIMSIFFVLLLFILLFSLIANPEGHLRAEIKKDGIRVFPIFGSPRRIDGPMVYLEKRFDLWSNNNSGQWVVEIRNSQGSGCLLLISSNKFEELESLIIHD